MLRAIPVGETTNYGALAAKLGTRDAQDVTEAIASNPIAVLVPCHRVTKKDGSISGYRWGFKRKRELQTREQRSAAANTFKDAGTEQRSTSMAHTGARL
jgi:AraC family transcriptional regulator of adaptative response/methylated-DNA-[protein]-cysteine methyltransferase